MAESLTNLSCVEFASQLAAKEPVPGGGGAAALVGALGAALCSMVGNYTTGKKTYAHVEEDIQRMLAKAQRVRLCLLELVQEDANAFFPLSQCYTMDRNDPKRAKTLEEATKGACAAPLEMMRQICCAIELLEEMGQKGSRMLLSDVACGALLCEAALQAASINVFVNTKSLTSKEFARVTEEEVNAMLVEYVPRAHACAVAVQERICG